MSKPDSIYRFEKATTAKEKYLLTEKQGADTLLLGKCKIGVDMGKEYILFAPTRENKTGGRQWDYSLYSTSPVLCAVKGKETGKANVSKVRISGVNFPPQFCGKAYGDTLSPYLTGADALLIELAQDAQHLTIAVFKGMAAQVRPLFEKWVAGQLCMVAASEALFCCLFSRKTSLLKPSFHGLKNDSAIKSYFYPQNLGGGQEKVIDHITLHSVGGLQNIEKLEDFHRGDTATGKAHIANMGVSCSLGGVILRGSLAKFHNGENCTDFARKDIETALIKL